MVDDVLNVRTRQSEHYRHNPLPALCTTCVDIHPFTPVEGKYGKGFLLTHTQILQTVCQAAGTFIPVFEVKLVVLILPPQLIRIIDGIHLQHITCMHPFTCRHF